MATSPLRSVYSDWEKRLTAALMAEWKRKTKQVLAALRPRYEKARHGVKASVPADLGLGEDFWQGWEDDYLVVIAPYFGEAAILGAAEALSGITVDFALVNAPARDWAKQFSSDLIKRNSPLFDSSLTETDIQAIRDNLAQWIDSPETFADLVNRITDVVGSEERAAMIAATESTRSYAAGSLIGWQAAGLMGEAEMEEARSFFPRHVGCRCWPTFIPGEGVRFNTANDELVEELCLALADTIIVPVAGRD